MYRQTHKKSKGKKREREKKEDDEVLCHLGGMEI
jgi:hypothetical protein